MVGIGVRISTRLLRRIVLTRVQDRHGNRNFIPHLQNCFHSLHGGSHFKVLASQTGLQIPIFNTSNIFQRCGMSSSVSSKSNADKTFEQRRSQDFKGVGSEEDDLSELMKMGDEIERGQNMSKENIEELQKYIEELQNMSNKNIELQNKSNKITRIEELQNKFGKTIEELTICENKRAELLKKYGMKEYDPINEQFDGTRHKALFGVVDPTKPLHSVAVVKKAGYMLHDQVLRLAEVGVIVAADIDELNKESQS